MNIYEVTFMTRQELSGPQVEELTAHFQKIITEAGGKILKTEQWGLKGLAYRINKAKKANYTLMEIETLPPALHEMERQMRLHDDVVRTMSLKLDSPTTEPSPQMKSYEKQEMKEAA